MPPTGIRCSLLLTCFIVSVASDGQALRAAAYKGNAAKVSAALKRGANINAKDDKGQTALMLASSNGHAKVVGLLLQDGANPNAETSDGKTALIWAEHKGHKQVAKILVEHGAKRKVQYELRNIAGTQV